MTTGTIKTQGSELYVINPLATEDGLLKFACPTGIQGAVGGAADQIEDTCLDALSDKSYVRGLGNPGQATVAFNFIPRNASHQMVLTDLLTDGRVLKWLTLFSESATPPTLDTDGAFVVPTDRSSVAFDAYISDVNIDVSTNEIVRGTLTLQRSGTPTWTFYEPA
jgi:tail tube protein